MPISTSSHSGSAVCSSNLEASCSPGCGNRPWLSSRFLTNPWSNALQTRNSKTTRCWGHMSHVNSHLISLGCCSHEVLRPVVAQSTANLITSPHRFCVSPRELRAGRHHGEPERHPCRSVRRGHPKCSCGYKERLVRRHPRDQE